PRRGERGRLPPAEPRSVGPCPRAARHGRADARAPRAVPWPARPSDPAPRGRPGPCGAPWPSLRWPPDRKLLTARTPRPMDHDFATPPLLVEPVTRPGRHVRLEPLAESHLDELWPVASEASLWEW